MKKLMIAQFLCLFALMLNAQDVKKPSLPKSYEAAFTQQFGGSEIQVAYARPMVRGRKIFGALIPFDSLWRTGANECTTVKFKEDVMVGDKSIAPGKYSLFTIPGEKEWTVILNTETTMHGTNGYNPQNDVHRFKVKSDKSERFFETFTIEINDFNAMGDASLNLAWENTMVKIPLKISTETSSNKDMADAKAKTDEHAGHDMSKMKNDMKDKKTDVQAKTDEHAGHDMSKMKNDMKDKKADVQAKTDEHAGHDMSKMKNTEGASASAAKEEFASVLAAYYGVKDALTADNAQGAAEKAKTMKSALQKIDSKSWTSKERSMYDAVAKNLVADADFIGNNASKIDQQRQRFMGLSNVMSSLTKSLKVNSETAYLQYCPMANNGKGAYWLSKDNKVKNPYYGKSMLTCGSIKETYK